MPERVPPGPSKPGMAHTPESADAPIGLDEKIVDATIAGTSRICPRRRRRTVDPAGTRRPDIDQPEKDKERPFQVETRGDRWTGSQSGDGKPEGRISSTPDGATGGRYDAPAAPFQSPMVQRKGGSGHGSDFFRQFPSLFDCARSRCRPWTCGPVLAAIHSDWRPVRHRLSPHMDLLC